MPIAFEHTPPNAFVGFIALSFLLILVSNTIYVKYIETRRNAFAVVSMLLFFVAMMSYEAFITYMPLYIFIVVGKTGFREVKKNIKLYFIPIFTAFVFLVLYVISGRLVPSGYGGNQLGFDNLLEPLKIIGSLFIVSIPGFYVFFPRYQYFKGLYYDLGFADYLRIGIFAVLFITVIVYAINRYTEINEGKKDKRGRYEVQNIINLFVDISSSI